MNQGEGYWSVIDPICNSIDIDGDPVVFVKQFNAVTPVAGHLFAAHYCQCEVCNGGFHQFFYNSTGILAPEALAGFSAIGLTEWAEILNEAMSFFGTSYPRDRDKRMALLPPQRGTRKEWDPFVALDERFFAWADAEFDRWEDAADNFAKSQMS